jgi:chromosome segregation ATPase
MAELDDGPLAQDSSVKRMQDELKCQLDAFDALNFKFLELEEDNCVLDEELDNAQQTVSILEARCLDLEDELQGTQKTIEILAGNDSRLDAELDAARSTIAILEANKMNLDLQQVPSQQLKKLEDALEHARSRHIAKVSSLEKELLSQSAELDGTRFRLQRRDQEIQDLRQQLNESQELLQQANLDIEELHTAGSNTAVAEKEDGGEKELQDVTATTQNDGAKSIQSLQDEIVRKTEEAACLMEQLEVGSRRYLNLEAELAKQKVKLVKLEATLSEQSLKVTAINILKDELEMKAGEVQSWDGDRKECFMFEWTFV